MKKNSEYKMTDQLEEQASTGDIEAFVFRNGEVVPADQAASTPGPVIHTAPEKNYGPVVHTSTEPNFALNSRLYR